MQKFKKIFSEGMPEENHKKNKQKSHIPFRLNLLFFIVFALFVALIVQLGYLQIINGESLQERIEASSIRKVETSTPRGMIYDAEGKPLVQNHANPAITYTRGLNVTADELLKVAETLVPLIEIEIDDKLTERDLKDTWLANKDNLEVARERLPKKNVDNEYQALVDAVTSEEIVFDEEQLKVATVFKQLNSAQELTTVFVKNSNVTNEELAIVSEHSKELPGISTGTDWSREVLAENDSLRSIIGKVSTEKQGLPAELTDEYLAKGYARNDRVGTSFLEKQYEEVLQGTKSQREITINHEGEIQSQKEIFSGEKGDNLVLTLNSEFQSKVDNILRTNYQQLVDANYATYSPGAYVVVLDTNTGGVLAMSGYYHEIHSKELQEDTIGVYKKSFVPGSVVKAATLTAGWQNGVLSGNEVIYDQPIYLEGSQIKASIFNPTGNNNQNLSARQSLEVSSNSYMIQIALRLLGIQYQGNRISVPSVPNQAKAYEQLRKAMAQYGMGTETGIDLPDEETGIQTPVTYLSDANRDGGKILDLSFGQFDTYTPMQLAQYVATVANDGVRLQPHLVEGIYGNSEDGGLGQVKQVIEPKVLNEVDLSAEELAIIQQGFRDVVTGSHPYTTGTRLRNSKIEIAAKTGTAEVLVVDEGRTIDVENSNVVAYGPASDPKVAVAVVIPQLQGLNRPAAHLEITNQIMDAYYEMFIKK
ncbi:penicillin-binding transpeptidase domain-containing protein [Enterococcus alcedinis]|uniref:Penicillin-binding protein n=1 Tax=Enterococcus alcedinis TaxID=1274384 RepID=A0A917JEI8_9ENTE|nr:penicillin-binding transpeptidase domain-containing protein [Enterococcus alcedinis]MBP2101186.1 penicillin-binding protein 2B [Enterococcus alcedinis]GGI64515.1 penicillin-binding protein [Enterococcus alcedinis]